MSKEDSSANTDKGEQRREIKSFVLRQGRLTRAQQSAIDHYWRQYGIDYSEQTLTLDSLFSAIKPLVLEIGFGNGDSLLQQAIDQPQYNYIGIEVHGPGVGHLIHNAQARNIDNIRVIRHDAIDVLKHQIPDASLQQLQLFFPDPWHKKRHHKRRIMNPDFIHMVQQKLVPQGRFHMATDWQHYAEQMLDQMDQAAGYVNVAGKGHYSEDRGDRCETKFERRGIGLGHGVWDLIYQKL